MQAYMGATTCLYSNNMATYHQLIHAFILAYIEVLTKFVAVDIAPNRGGKS